MAKGRQSEMDVEDTLAMLSKIRRQLDAKKGELNKLQGRRDSLLARFKKDFDLDGVEGVKAEITTLSDQLIKINKSIGAKIKTLGDKYDLSKY